MALILPTSSVDLEQASGPSHAEKLETQEAWREREQMPEKRYEQLPLIKGFYLGRRGSSRCLKKTLVSPNSLKKSSHTGSNLYKKVVHSRQNASNRISQVTPQIVELEIEDLCDLGGLSANELPMEELNPAISKWFVAAFIARIPVSDKRNSSLPQGNYPTSFNHIFIRIL